MGPLLPYDKYTGQTQRPRQLDTQHIVALHLARLETTGTEKEKPDSAGRPEVAGLRLEQDPERWLGGGSKSNPDNDGDREKAGPEGV